jgi:hypothetical protein
MNYPGNPYSEESFGAQSPLPPMDPLTPRSPPTQSPVQAPPATTNIAQPYPEPATTNIAQPHPEPGHIRQIIDFSPSTVRVLVELANGGSIGDALRDAIALSKWFNDTREEGGRILVEHNGKLREVTTIKYPPDK